MNNSSLVINDKQVQLADENFSNNSNQENINTENEENRKYTKISEQNHRINLYTTNTPLIAFQIASINPYFKESYYKSNAEELKESERELKHRHELWNYMMNVSMQNAVVQMRKIA